MASRSEAIPTFKTMLLCMSPSTVLMGSHSQPLLETMSRSVSPVQSVHGCNMTVHNNLFSHLNDILSLHLGHCATVHAASIGDNCLIGMGSTVLDGAKVRNSLNAIKKFVFPY